MSGAGAVDGADALAYSGKHDPRALLHGPMAVDASETVLLRPSCCPFVLHGVSPSPRSPLDPFLLAFAVLTPTYSIPCCVGCRAGRAHVDGL